MLQKPHINYNDDLPNYFVPFDPSLSVSLSFSFWHMREVAAARAKSAMM